MTLTQRSQADVSLVERNVRTELAAFYRLVAHFGMSDLIYNHITTRVPDHDEHLLINPYGRLYNEVTASGLNKIDIEGNVLEQPDPKFGVNRPGYMIHSAVHAARPDVACVVHTHARASMAVGTMESGLLPLTQQAMRFHGNVAYHDYGGVFLVDSEKSRLARDLGMRDVMLLRNHGLLVCGRTIAETWNRLYWFETACRVQVDAMASGVKLIEPSPESIAEIAGVYASNRPPSVELEWAAMLRLLDREDPSYRD